MPKFAGRSNAACNYCHRQKVKCSGEQPCQRCRQRQRHCTYSTRGDRTVAVSEKHLEHLKTTLSDLTNAIRVTGNSTLAPTTPGSATPRATQVEQAPPAPAPAPATQAQAEPESEEAVAPLVEDSTAESFIRKLKEVLYNVDGGPANALVTLATAFPTTSSPYSSSCGEGSGASQRRHANMRFDTIHSKLSFKLPPYQYAVQLISQAEQSFGDYHTFLRRSFWKRLHATYKNLSSQAKDRNWLCRLSFVLALAEANNHNNQSLTITLDESGLLMMKVSYEDPTVDDVEALNLASHCSFILNRRKAAYAYAGQSVRLAHSIGLDQPAPASLSNLEREHRMRVWWTAFCVDRATSTELCLHPAYVGMDDDLDYPDSSGLSVEDLEEFFDPDLLTAQIKLLQIKGHVITVVSQLKSRHVYQRHDLLHQCLQRLEQCRNDMPATLSPLLEFDFQARLNTENRVPFSLSLRYHQCYVLLLRPLLLHQLASMLRGDMSIYFKEEVRTTNSICLQAARTNAKTMLHLAASHMLVEYGYWDSVHLFSSLTVMCLAKIMARGLPGPFVWQGSEWDEDVALYDQAREVLVNMIQCGNISSRYHLEMLTEIESIGDTMLQPGNNSGSTLDGALRSLPVAQVGNVEDSNEGLFRAGDVRLGRELGFDDWAELLEQPVLDFTSFDIYSTSLG
ncbi:hypothetical protein ACJZ2D_003404 [Fusarium nematophilum]